MVNELIFLLHIVIMGSMVLASLALGKEALIAFVGVQAILANLFVLKQITLLGYTATAADVYIVGSVLTLNILHEYYGKALTQKAIWISFALLVFYTIASMFQLWYLPALCDCTHVHFYELLNAMPRITIASMITYIIVQYTDTMIYAFLRTTLSNRFLLLRNYATLGISQLLDTVLFGFLGLYGIVDNIWQIMIVSYCIKIMALLIAGPFIIITKYNQRK